MSCRFIFAILVTFVVAKCGESLSIFRALAGKASEAAYINISESHLREYVMKMANKLLVHSTLFAATFMVATNVQAGTPPTQFSGVYNFAGCVEDGSDPSIGTKFRINIKAGVGNIGDNPETIISNAQGAAYTINLPATCSAEGDITIGEVDFEEIVQHCRATNPDMELSFCELEAQATAAFLRAWSSTLFPGVPMRSEMAVLPTNNWFFKALGYDGYIHHKTDSKHGVHIDASNVYIFDHGHADGFAFKVSKVFGYGTPNAGFACAAAQTDNFSGDFNDDDANNISTVLHMKHIQTGVCSAVYADKLFALQVEPVLEGDVLMLKE